MRSVRNRLILALVLLTMGWAMMGHGLLFLNGRFGISLNPLTADWRSIETYGVLLVGCAVLVIASAASRANRCPVCSRKMTSFREEPICECPEVR